MTIRELFRKLFRKPAQPEDEDRFTRVDDARVDAFAQGGADFPPNYVKQDDGRPRH